MVPKTVLLFLGLLLIMAHNCKVIAQDDNVKIAEAKTAIEKNDCRTAIDILKEVSAEGKGIDLFIYYYAEACSCLHSYDTAIKYYTKYLDFFPGNAEVTKKIADLDLQMRQEKKDAFEKAAFEKQQADRRRADEAERQADLRLKEEARQQRKAESEARVEKDKNDKYWLAKYNLKHLHNVGQNGAWTVENDDTVWKKSFGYTGYLLLCFDGSGYSNTGPIQTSTGFGLKFSLVPGLNKYCVFESDWTVDRVFDYNKNYISSLFGMPITKSKSSSATFSTSISILPFLLNKSSIALSVGPKAGVACFLFPTFEIPNSSLDHTLSMNYLNLFYGWKVNLFLGGTMCFYYENSFVPSTAITAVSDNKNVSGGQTNFSWSKVGLAFRIDGTVDERHFQKKYYKQTIRGYENKDKKKHHNFR